MTTNPTPNPIELTHAEMREVIHTFNFSNDPIIITNAFVNSNGERVCQYLVKTSGGDTVTTVREEMTWLNGGGLSVGPWTVVA